MASFTLAQEILDQIKANLAAVTDIRITLDEPLEYVWEDLPEINLFPVQEDFSFENSSNSQDDKQLQVRLALKMPGGPASSVCTPVINAICEGIRQDRTLNGLAYYVELQSIKWFNDKISEGHVCAATLEFTVNYLTDRDTL